MKKFFRSLQAKYMLIIFIAISLVQITFLAIAIIVAEVADKIETPEGVTPDEIEKAWHEDAGAIEDVSKETIEALFAKWKKEYPEASMFWVDGNGHVAEQIDVKTKHPETWTHTYTAKFIKDRYGGDPFTVIAFVGKDETNGFVVFEISRERFLPPMQTVYDQFGAIMLIGMFIVIIIFIIISYLFFRSIRKRLLDLQESMTTRDADGLPVQTEVKKEDEVGQLEQTFNQMVVELRESKKREQEEEQLRRELIANLSHDLRTPLTKISSQIYSLSKENVSEEAKRAIQAMETSIRDIDRLIENLVSYTLLMASKYKIDRKDVDVIRFVRERIASWYSAFEKEGFEIDVDLRPFENNVWVVDPMWLSRIFDNLFQNVLRHAKSGRFIQVKTESTPEYDGFVIADRGPGMKHDSKEKGAGIGLSIVDMMVKGMGLEWKVDTSEQGTTVKIMKRK